MASGVYTIWKTEIMKKTVDMVNDVVKAILLNNSHTFSAANSAYSDISANELATEGGYTQNNKELATKAVAAAAFDAADTAWTSATFTAYHCVLYDDTHASDILICSIDFGGAQTVTSGTFTIQWNASGIITLT